MFLTLKKINEIKHRNSIAFCTQLSVRFQLKTKLSVTRKIDLRRNFYPRTFFLDLNIAHFSHLYFRRKIRLYGHGSVVTLPFRPIPRLRSEGAERDGDNTRAEFFLRGGSKRPTALAVSRRGPIVGFHRS